LKIQLTATRHAAVYAIVNGAILLLGLVLLSMTPWWIWVLPALAWGVGLAIHALVALTSDEDDWLEHEQSMQWWHEQRRRRHDERMARIRATEPRARIEEHKKELRVASDTRDAEEEAAAAEAEARAHRRRRR